MYSNSILDLSYNALADLNTDGVIDVIDIVNLVNWILSYNNGY